jgi:hypothetical protein
MKLSVIVHTALRGGHSIETLEKLKGCTLLLSSKVIFMIRVAIVTLFLLKTFNVLTNYQVFLMLWYFAAFIILEFGLKSIPHCAQTFLLEVHSMIVKQQSSQYRSYFTF